MSSIDQFRLDLDAGGMGDDPRRWEDLLAGRGVDDDPPSRAAGDHIDRGAYRGQRVADVRDLVACVCSTS